MNHKSQPPDVISSVHLARGAYVYIRQSTITQVREHKESLERQYELVERARNLGWQSSDISVIDDDLGRSGSESSCRDGFRALVAAVGLSKVGIILGIEVSRLARNNSDWYQLLDLCALTDTLIADGDGIYHPGRFNDRLVLGLKGTMSEAELHVIRHRLTEGLLHKAAKGELRQGLPVGYIYDEDDKVILHQDESVVGTISSVFRRFSELGSARQVLFSLLDDNILLPHQCPGSPRISWEPPTYPAIHRLLTNPCYAGAFVFGRNRSEKYADSTGRLHQRVIKLPVENWTTLIKNHHQGYVSWEEYLLNQDKLRANAKPRRGEPGGAVREGGAYLQAIVRCGKCGRKMQVGYSGISGKNQRYLCTRAKILYGRDKPCQSIGGKRLDRLVLNELFSVLQPASLAATLKALEDFEESYAVKLKVFELSLERAGYEAGRAQRRYDAVEPENRLVARRLETALEEALRRYRQAKLDLDAAKQSAPKPITMQESKWLLAAGADIEKVFNCPTTDIRQRKMLLRTVIKEVVVTVIRPRDTAEVKVIFEGGAVTSLELPLKKTSADSRTTAEDTVDLIRRLAERYSDTVIAQVLSRQGRKTALGLSFTRARVASLRLSRNIPICPNPESVTASCEDEVMSITSAQKILGVDRSTIYRWLKEGFIIGEQLTPGGPWHIRVTDDVKRRIVPEVPQGWLSLSEAAAALGVARQTVLHRVQRGQLEAVYVNKGRRKGLRINVIRSNIGLFETRK